MNQYGFKSTQCYETTDLKADPVTAKKALDAFISTGHEICSHTVTHPFLSQLTTAQVDQELADSKSFLEQLTGIPIVDFASPFGDYSESVNTEIKKYYQSHRTVDEGYNSKDNFDAYRLRVQNMTPTTTLAQYNGWLAQAKADNTWLILVYHDIVNTNPSPYGSFTSDFQQQMAALNASGLTVKTYKDALAEVQAQ
jgi:peptidoglycan/xylan/chitin deacetylase (PgdA/CDA1 family)